ncbi:hypothetical protein GCM10029992_54600 [Glycomyces albus]
MPSLSPDGTRIAFKERTGDGARPWRLAVLDLGTGRETGLPGTDGVDDQALWLDGDTLAYGSDGGVWAVAADGSAEPRLLAEDAASPSIVGGWGPDRRGPTPASKAAPRGRAPPRAPRTRGGARRARTGRGGWGSRCADAAGSCSARPGPARRSGPGRGRAGR